MNVNFFRTILYRYGPHKLVKFLLAYLSYRLFKLRFYELHALRSHESLFSAFEASHKDDAPFIYGEFPLEKLSPYLNDPTYELSPDFLEETRKAKSRCFACLQNGKLIAYSFFSNVSTPIDEKIRVHFEEGWVYAYKVLTHKDYRGRMISAELLRTAFREFRRESFFRGFFCFVFSDNLPSLHAFRRMGFKIEASSPVLDYGAFAVLLKPKMSLYGGRLEFKSRGLED